RAHDPGLHPAVLVPAAVRVPARAALPLRRLRAVPGAVPPPAAVSALRRVRPQPDRRAPGAHRRQASRGRPARLTEGRAQMTYTPVELRHVRVARRPFGYDRAGVEQILSDVADSFETVWRDRGELADRVETLEQQLEQARQREQLLTNTLVAAERAAEEMRDRGRREAELIVSEAHAEARSVMHQSQAERERLLAEVRRIEILLRSALGSVGDAAVSPTPQAT